MSQKNIKETGKREKIQANIVCDYTTEELLKMPRKEIIKPLTDREVAFCEYYILDHNIKVSAYKAGLSVSGGFKLRHRKHLVNYLEWLKARSFNHTLIDASDLINTYAKMAFYDINDYLEVYQNGRIKLRDAAQIDGKIIQELSINNSGSFTVKFPDRMKAMEKLEDFIPNLPSFRRQAEERRLKLLEERLEIDKQRVGFEQEIEDDNFIEALNNVAKGVFEDDDKNDSL